jgi:hypothetical protein
MMAGQGTARKGGARSHHCHAPTAAWFPNAYLRRHPFASNFAERAVLISNDQVDDQRPLLSP